VNTLKIELSKININKYKVKKNIDAGNEDSSNDGLAKSVNKHERTGNIYLKNEGGYVREKFRSQPIKKEENINIISTSPPTSMFGYLDPWADPEYQQALEMKQELIEKYSGNTVDDIFDGDTLENEFGTCYILKSEYNLQMSKYPRDICLQNLYSDLQLVYGIGPHYKSKLNHEGYSTLHELKKHPRWCNPAKQVIDIISEGDVNNLHDWMKKYYPISHPNIYQTSSFFDSEELVILDIETMGLFESPIILLGIAKQRNNILTTTQILLKDISNEPSALLETYKKLDESMAILSYNGKSFDIPYLQSRLAFYGLSALNEKTHFDLLHYTRRAWRDELDNCKLNTVEDYLGVKREIDLPSSLVPSFYDTYLKTGNPGPLVPIIEHNKQDLVSLVLLYNKLHEVWT